MMSGSPATWPRRARRSACLWSSNCWTTTATSPARPGSPRRGAGVPDRNRQFEDIARLNREYLDSVDPILSMDTKKKQLIGNFYRAGHLKTQWVIDRGVRSEAERRPCEPGHQPRQRRVRPREHRAVMGGSRPGILSTGEFDPSAVRWRRRWEQRRQSTLVQKRHETAGRTSRG